MHIYLACLHTIGLLDRQIALLMDGSDDYQRLYETLDHARLARIGLRDDHIDRILERRSQTDTEAILSPLAELHVRLVLPTDSEYPPLLRHVPDPPTLYVRGILRDIPLIAVIGSRKHTNYATHVLPPIVQDLVSAGYGIASGGAYGVDSLGHGYALDAGGYTIAVVGTGIDVIYPASHRHLYERIIESGGAIVSQFPLGSQPDRFRFPLRNAVIAGMSRGVVVVEAGPQSGTLITSRLALELGRDVFAIPWDVGREGSIGPNSLIRDGHAKCTTSAADILSEYGTGLQMRIDITPAPDEDTGTPEELALLSLLRDGEMDMESLSQKTDMDVPLLIGTLTCLEISGKIEMTVSGGYRRKR